MQLKEIKWGIIGCGNVTEVKSGPAFNKVMNSSMHAVMRRDTAKAKDYALRHNVPRWYDNADDLINDPEINAVYIATPPNSHAPYAIKAAKAGGDNVKKAETKIKEARKLFEIDGAYAEARLAASKARSLLVAP